jgi:transcriptional regulator with XRE-family HTH domain
MDELSVGARVAYWRRHRRMSQQVFADRLGKSKSWVDKVERGVRRLDKCSTVREVAEVLHVEVQALLDGEPQRRPDRPSHADGGADRVDVEAIRYRLECYTGAAAYFHRSPPGGCASEVDKAVGHAWSTLQRADYVALSRVLPPLLHAAQAGCRAAGAGNLICGGCRRLITALRSCRCRRFRDASDRRWSLREDDRPCCFDWPTSA